METSSNRNHLSTAEVPAVAHNPMGQDLDRTRQDATRAWQRSRFGNLKLSESSSRPTVIYLIDNSVCSLLCKAGKVRHQRTRLGHGASRKCRLGLVFEYVTTHNRDTAPIKANASHYNTLCKRF